MLNLTPDEQKEYDRVISATYKMQGYYGILSSYKTWIEKDIKFARIMADKLFSGLLSSKNNYYFWEMLYCLDGRACNWPNEIKEEHIDNMFLLIKNGLYTHQINCVRDIILTWPYKEEHAIKILNLYDRNLKRDTLYALMEKVQDKSKIATFLNTNKYIKLDTYKNANLNDPLVRSEFVNYISQNTSLLKSIDFQYQFTLADLQSLPPMRRFDFIKKIYNIPIQAATNIKNNRPEKILSVIGRRIREDAPLNITVERIKEDDMKALLFSASIRSNSKAKNWYDKYALYLKSTDKIKILAENLKTLLMVE